MQEVFWVLEATPDPRFPYRLSIEKGGNLILRLRVQERWPGSKGQIFCMREEGREWPAPLYEVERVPVISLRRFGKRLAIILDRAQNKRCDFLFLEKPYKTKQGKYEQIFWRTEKALKERRLRVKLTVRGSPILQIAIDIKERYPWKFHGCTLKKVNLPAGDYALLDKDGIQAVVERKTLENMLTEFSRMSAFHQQLGELEAYPHSALVIEANFSDFLKPEKMRFYSPSFALKALSEMFALHPHLQIVFAGNRKLAREWTLSFFSTLKSHQEDIPHPSVSEAIKAYGIPSLFYGGVYYDLRKRIEKLPHTFTFEMIRKICPDVPEMILKKSLQKMKKDNLLRRVNKKWEKIDE